MNEKDWLAQGFEAHRAHLRRVAYRMLGSPSEAEDAVQEAWLRLSRSEPASIENLGGWLTTAVARVCLDMLRSRRARREDPITATLPEAFSGDDPQFDPEHEAVLADSVGLALMVVLETMSPAERVAFVLHDVFGVPFDEIAPIVGRTSVAARQLASRARQRVQAADPTSVRDVRRHRVVVDAFLAAARGGDLGALVALLDPDVALRADATTVRAGAEAEVRGAEAVAATFAGRARVARTALINGSVGAAWMQGDKPRVVFEFRIVDKRIVGIDLVADPDVLSQLELAIL